MAGECGGCLSSRADPCSDSRALRARTHAKAAFKRAWRGAREVAPESCQGASEKRSNSLTSSAAAVNTHPTGRKQQAAGVPRTSTAGLGERRSAGLLPVAPRRRLLESDESDLSLAAIRRAIIEERRDAGLLPVALQVRLLEGRETGLALLELGGVRRTPPPSPPGVPGCLLPWGCLSGPRAKLPRFRYLSS
jgi:hypothetical protein